MKKIQIALIFVFVILTSCQNQSKSLMSSVTGKAGEVVLIIAKGSWESEIGEKYRNILQQEQVGLPQDEPMFDLVQITPASFSKIFQTHRNIIFSNISNDISEAKISIKNDVWAYPQIVIKIEAPDEISLMKLLKEYEKTITDRVLQAERQRIIHNYRKYEEQGISSRLKKRHNISLTIPKGYEFDVDTANFAWITHETSDISQGILIYSYKYEEENNFSLNFLLNKRDEFCKKFVPGPSKNSYMTTDRIFSNNFEEKTVNENYVAEIRGLWRVENDFMGGPFISFSTLDKKRNRVITIDAYVYAPKFNKRNYLRQLEGILYSLKIL